MVWLQKCAAKINVAVFISRQSTSLSQADIQIKMIKKIRIGTRESQLALWQANLVKSLLKHQGIESELVTIKSEGDLDLSTPLYAMGVQGIFTRSLDQALLNNQIDLAVHSMKDVPV